MPKKKAAKKAAKKKPMTKKAKKRAKDKYKAKKKRKTAKASAKKKTKKRPTKSKKKAPAPAGTPFFFEDTQAAEELLDKRIKELNQQRSPKPQPKPEPVQDATWQVTKSSKPQWTDTGKAEASMLLGILRDRAFLVSRAKPEDVDEILKDFSKRTLVAYDHLLNILDPNVMNLRFRTEVRFADEASAKAAAEEMQVTR